MAGRGPHRIAWIFFKASCLWVSAGIFWLVYAKESLGLVFIVLGGLLGAISSIISVYHNQRQDATQYRMYGELSQPKTVDDRVQDAEYDYSSQIQAIHFEYIMGHLTMENLEEEIARAVKIRDQRITKLLQALEPDHGAHPLMSRKSLTSSRDTHLEREKKKKEEAKLKALKGMR